MFKKLLTFALSLFSLLVLSGSAQAQGATPVCSPGYGLCYDPAIRCCPLANDDAGAATTIPTCCAGNVFYAGCAVNGSCVADPTITTITQRDQIPDSQLPQCPVGWYDVVEATPEYPDGDISAEFCVPVNPNPPPPPPVVCPDTAQSCNDQAGNHWCCDSGRPSVCCVSTSTNMGTCAYNGQTCANLAGSGDNNENNNHSHGCSVLSGSHHGGLGLGGLLLTLFGLCWLGLRRKERLSSTKSEED